MTIAISIKVNDGVVLASDSATTIRQIKENGTAGVLNVYENAEKIFNLYKGKPVGIITWGSGSIGQFSIPTLIKDFQKLIEKDDRYQIDEENYTMEEIAHKFKNYIFEEKYEKQYAKLEKEQRPRLGFMICGYSPGEDFAEEYIISIFKGNCRGPELIRNKEMTGASWQGEPEAVGRLYLGFSNKLKTVLKKHLQLEEEQADDVIQECKKQLQVPLVVPAMPIQDAIDLASFFVETTVRFSKFMPGPPTVSGPTEIAAITKHEGFQWVSRKYYFDKDVNI